MKALEEDRTEKQKKGIADKILFTGLDNGGKTTIIKILEKEYSRISMLKPTRQAQRKIFNYLGKAISEWDLGGQERYRIAYLKEPTKYFDDTSICIYTIDIQDQYRIEEALSYFEDVVDVFKELEIEPYIFVFFHKMDPDFEKEHGVYARGRISEIKNKIREIINQEFNVTFMQTTIFDLWSIINAFSQILLKLYPQSELLDKTIEDFAERIKVEAAIILDENSLVVGQTFQDEEAKNILASSTPYFLTLSDTLERKALTDRAMVVERGEKLFYIDQFKLDDDRGTMFLLLMKDRHLEKTFNKEKVASFVKILRSIL